MAVTIGRETSLDPQTRRRFAAIYDVSFPPSERDDVSSVVANIGTGSRLCYVARIDGELAGFAVLSRLDGLDVVLLEYLAVDPEERNAGIGGALLVHLEKNLCSDFGTQGILLEVEPPEEADGEERLLRTRRVGFYLRHGASIVRGAPSYRTPNLDQETGTISYTLLWIPLSDEAPSEPTGSYLRRCIEAILTQSYSLSSDDRLVREVVEEVAR